MDLTLFNSYKEKAAEENQTIFDSLLTSSTHSDEDKHSIGETLPSPKTVKTTGTATLGTSPNPAREDHVHDVDFGFLPNPITKYRYGVELGSSAAPGIYWPDTGGSQNLGLYSINNGLVLSFNGSSIIELGAGNGIRSLNLDGTFPNLVAQGLFGSGGSVQAGTLVSDMGSGITVGPDELDMNQHDIVDGNRIYCDGWFRSEGDTGWYSEDHEGGIRMTDADWVKAYDCLGFQTNGGMSGGLSTTSTYTGYQDIVWNTSFTSWHRFTSSLRFKEEIYPLKVDTRSVLQKLNPVQFILKPTGEETPEEELFRKKDVQWGFIAEEVCAIDEELGSRLGSYETDVDNPEKLIPSSWSPRPMIPLIVAEMQALIKEVEELKKEVSYLRLEGGML